MKKISCDTGEATICKNFLSEVMDEIGVRINYIVYGPPSPYVVNSDILINAVSDSEECLINSCTSFGSTKIVLLKSFNNVYLAPIFITLILQ
jgi:hypothetical protein